MMRLMRHLSTGGLINLFNIEETVDENGIPYQEFSQVPSDKERLKVKSCSKRSL